MISMKLFKSNQRNGQVTLFIILGIIIVVSMILLFVFVSNRSSNQTEIKESLSQIDQSSIIRVSILIRSCIEDSLIESIYGIGIDGGFLKSIPGTLTVPISDGDIIVFTDISQIPSDDDITTAISNAFYDTITTRCSLQVLRDEVSDLGISLSGYKTPIYSYNLSLNENDISVKLDYYLKISKESAEKNLDPIFVKVPTRLKKINQIINNISSDYYFSQRSGSDLDVASLCSYANFDPKINFYTFDNLTLYQGFFIQDNTQINEITLGKKEYSLRFGLSPRINLTNSTVCWT